MKHGVLILISLICINAYAQTNKELSEKIEILAEEINNLKSSNLSNEATQSYSGLGNSASKVYQIKKGVSIGAYGEIYYQNFENKNEDDQDVKKNAKTEALRNVIYLGYKFDKNWLINTEIEIEHADEIYSEFMFLDYMQSPEFNARFGLLLVPMGLVNEKHEPNLFNSVSRPEVEQKIIPSTWRENGLGIYGTKGNLSYRAYYINGFDAEGFSSDGLRGGRKKGGAGGDTNAETNAIVTRLDYSFDNSSTFGVSFYKGNASTTSADLNEIGVTIVESHFDVTKNFLNLRGLFVIAKLDDVENFNTESGSNIAEEMAGGYFEAAYDILRGKMGKTLNLFTRFEKYDTQLTLADGATKDFSKDRTNTTMGLAYKPTNQIVFKFDYTLKSNKAESGVNEYNLGFGYQF